MRSTLLSLFLFSLCIFSLGYAQPPGSRGKGQRMAFADRPAIGNITGSVIDSLQNEPIAYASIALVLAENDSVVGGTLTTEKGLFSITEVRPAAYTLVIQALGYKKRTLDNLRFSPKAPIKDLGKISLESVGATMDEVEITAEKSFMSVKLDKKVFEADAVLTAQGGVATDLLENIPSVEVDIDGNVSLRGDANVTILIDGRPSGLTGVSRAAILEQLPASSIDKIEVITNPSSRYDADGLSGIINIVLKKNKKLGINGNIQAGLSSQGSPKASPEFLPPNKYNIALGLNYRDSKINLFGNYSYNYRDQFSEGTTDRTNFLSTGTTVLDQSETGTRFGGGHVGRAGIDVFLPNKHTLSFSTTLSDRDRNSAEDILYDLRNEEGDALEAYTRISEELDGNQSIDLTVAWDKKYKEDDHQLSASVNQSWTNGSEIVNFSQENTDGNTPPVPGRNYEDASANITVAQLDYVRPTKTGYEMEGGLKVTVRDLGTNFRAENQDINSGKYVDDPFLSNNFQYLEQVYAAYGMIGKQRTQWGWQLGLRAEQTLTGSELIQTGETFTNNYFGVFPSGILNFQSDKNAKGKVQLSFSRRVRRPRRRQLNPFTDFSDPLNLRRGNPFLLPEFINSFELSYQRKMGKITFMPSIYYRRLSQVINRFKTIDSIGVATTTYANQASGDDIGVEMIVLGQITDWWNINISANGYYTKLDASNLEAELSNAGFGYGGRLMSTFKLSKTSNLQVSGFYRGPRPYAQGEISDIFSTNIAFQKRLWNNKATLLLKISDVFDTRRFAFESSGEGFTSFGYRKRESRIISLNFTYRFGKQVFDKRNRSRQGGDDGGDFDSDI